MFNSLLIFTVLSNKMTSKIQTYTDPKFVYSYSKTKFVPPQGKTLLMIGQTYERITGYTEKFKKENLPGGWSAYWGIPEFSGITSSFKNETGSTQNHQYFIDSFPDTVLHSALWMVGHVDVAGKTVKGNYDDVILKFSRWVKLVQRPVYFRLGYEFDGIHNALETNVYVKAYRRIVDTM